MDQLEAPLHILQLCLDRRFTELKTRKQFLEEEEISFKIIETLLQLRYDVRYYVLCTDEQVRELWETLRANEPFTDFLLSLKSEFIARIGRLEATKLSEYLSEGVSRTAYDETLIDEDTFSRFPSATWIDRVIKKNDWLLVLFLLDCLPVTNIIRFTSELAILNQ